MTNSRQDVIRKMATRLAAASAATSAMVDASLQNALTSANSELLLDEDIDHLEAAPIGYDRLPLEWHQTRAGKLKERLANSRAVDAILLSTDQNIVYFTGCFRGSGERPTWSLLRTSEENTVYWYSPGIDRDLIESWWSTENEY